MHMETLASTFARPYVALWFYSPKVEEEENLETSVFTEVAAC